MDRPAAGDRVGLGSTKPVHNVNSLWKNSTTPVEVLGGCGEHVARRPIGVSGVAPDERRSTDDEDPRPGPAACGIVGLRTVPSIN